MFLSKRTPPPLQAPESNGVEIKVRLSEATFIKLVSIAVAVLLGSGVWVAQSASPPPDASTNPVEVTP